MCSNFYISLVGKFQQRSTGRHLLFLVNKMPILESIPWMWLADRKQIFSIFVSSSLKVLIVVGVPQNRDQGQRGAEEKGQGKEACDCLLRPCWLAAGQESLPKSCKYHTVEYGSSCQRTLLILRGKFSCEAPSVCSTMMSGSVSKHSLLFGPKW